MLPARDCCCTQVIVQYPLHPCAGQKGCRQAAALHAFINLVRKWLTNALSHGTTTANNDDVVAQEHMDLAQTIRPGILSSAMVFSESGKSG